MPEEKARQVIDKKLIDAGYVLQDMSEFNPNASLGVVVREFPTKSGEVDYLIFIDKIPVGVIEAKATHKGESLTSVAEQSKRYAESGLVGASSTVNIRFAYESTDVITNFCDYNDSKFCSREVFSFHTPKTLQTYMKESDTLRNRLKVSYDFDTDGFRDCQVEAITNLEKSFSDARPRALIQMATGAGKTFTAITSVYRLLKNNKASRILFLVDTKNLGEQTIEEFKSYKPNDDSRLFPELYNVTLLKNSNIPTDSQVCISTIQRMYSILRSEELDSSLEENSAYESFTSTRPREVAYNEKYPIEFFDFIIVDECHRSIYNVWQQVLDYFDAFIIGLTATPDARTFGFFNENIVSEYSHEQAVIDDVNVGRTGTFIIETKIGKQGGTILEKVVQKRDRLSRKKRWEQNDEDINYQPSNLDRDIVNISQIRHVIRAFKDNVLTKIFPTRKEVPKTLFFAKTDSHAEDIVKMIREEFGESNEFCKKITYASEEDPKSVLSAFRNEYNPRIAVTVDMIATGTDVKPIECLVFMRDVRSKNYFEQMIGRATRTLKQDDLKKVSPSATQRKMGFIIVDAVGVTTSQKTTARELDRNPSATLKQLMQSVLIGDKDEDTITTLADRLLNLDKTITDKQKEEVAELTDGVTIKDIAQNLLESFDEDVILEKANSSIESDTLIIEEELPQEQREIIVKELVEQAILPIYKPEFREKVLKLRKKYDQIMDETNLDEVIFADWDSTKAEMNINIIETFKQFIQDNKDKIEALSIIYNQAYKNREITFKMIEEMYEVLTQEPYGINNEMLWNAYYGENQTKVKKRVEDKLADIIALLKYELGQSEELNVFSADVSLKFKTWVFNKNSGAVQFTEEQMEWLRMVKEHISTSIHIDTDDLEYTPFDKLGGLGKFYELFGDDYEVILTELNEFLIA